MTTTTDPAGAFRAAIAGAGLPDGLAWSVTVTARRKHLGASVEPGGAVVFKVPATMTPERVAEGVRRMRGRVAVAATDKRERGATIARKELVNGEGFRLAGTNHRLTLVDDADTGRRCPCQCARPITAHPGVSIIAEPGHATWSGGRTWQLTMRRDATSARTVIEWYRERGQAWLDEHMPAILDRFHVPADARPTWSVRPYRQGDGYGGSWGVYRSKPHTIRFHWMIFQFPADLLRHIATHEAAHAALRSQYASHGREWQLLMERTGPQWRDLERRARTADGLVLWAGELETDAAPVTVASRQDGPAGGHTRYRLSNGWFIDREQRPHRREYREHPYALYVPGGGPGGNTARCIGTDKTLTAALERANTARGGVVREDPAAEPSRKLRGAGPVVCCGGHRERCLIGHAHTWATWYRDGRLVRTADTYRCDRCGGVCTAEESDQPAPAEAAPFVSGWAALAAVGGAR